MKLALLPLIALLAAPLLVAAAPKTTVSIAGDGFLINGRPTYEGRTWNGRKIEGLLMNSRMVQGIFDDQNPATVARWAYPDTGKWDAERNTREFLAAMPVWRAHGLLSFTINLQGGSPEGYSRVQPWRNSAIDPDGSLRPDYLARLKRIVDFADDLGMVVVLGYFYFGQDQLLADEAAVIRAVDNATRWIHDHGWRHVIIEVNNECNVRYDHAVLQPPRVHELIERVKAMKSAAGHRLLVSTSYGGNTIPGENVVRAADFLLLHGNGVSDPKRIAEMVQLTRKVAGYTPKPIFFNEDDHFNFEVPDNNFTAAVGEYAGWGYFDFRMKGEGYAAGSRASPPTGRSARRARRDSSGCWPRSPDTRPAPADRPHACSSRCSSGNATSPFHSWPPRNHCTCRFSPAPRARYTGRIRASAWSAQLRLISLSPSPTVQRSVRGAASAAISGTSPYASNPGSVWQPPMERVRMRSWRQFNAPAITATFTRESSAVTNVAIRPPSERPTQPRRPGSTSLRRARNPRAHRQSRRFSPRRERPSNWSRRCVVSHASLRVSFAFAASRGPNGVRQGAATTYPRRTSCRP